ncbi:MAG: hypothetical protein HY650_08275 [Acidobacteria bacterium]|nr:hypothetical protein [Acidobacteriota bacterium]
MWVPRLSVLEHFVRRCAGSEGIDVTELEPFQIIHAQTLNHEYRLTMIDAREGRVIVEGGAYFPEPVEGHLRGSSAGGAMLRLGWIGLGLHMEIESLGHRLVTSPVRALRVEEERLQ